MTNYFSDRENGPAPRTRLEVTQPAWGGLVALISGLIESGGLGIDFPEQCPDGRGPTGTNSYTLGLAVRAEIPELEWPLRPEPLPSTLALLDLLEFCHRHAAEPIQAGYHSYFGHYHLDFERTPGQHEFRNRVNRILARNHVAFELDEAGLVRRLAPPVLEEALATFEWKTGDRTFDELLEAARTKFLDPDPAVRREALEKLWDAWERVKTMEPGKNKKESAKALLDKAADETTFRGLLEEEAKALTAIGNTFRIRHSETTQIELGPEDHVDYLFHRMFGLIWMLLRCR